MNISTNLSNQREPVFLSIIIPAYNESSRLPDTLEKIHTFLQQQDYSYEVLVVENGSTDHTLDLAKAFSAAHPQFRAIHNELNGKGRAVQTGMLAARGAYRFMCDADSSMPIEEVNRFLPSQIGTEIEVVIASREAPGAVRYHESDYRHIGGRLVNLVIRWLAIKGIQDTQCGYKMFRADVAEDLFTRQQLVGWSFDIEILFIARLRKYQIIELPIPWYFSELSHVKPVKDTLRMVWDILIIHLNHLKGLYAPQV